MGGLRWDKALTLAEGLLDRDEDGGLVDRLPLRARFLGGRGDKEAGKSSFFWSCFEEVVEAAVDGVVCADVGNGMTLISLGMDFVLVLVFFTCGRGTATKRPSWRVLSTCITFSDLQAETLSRERVQVERDLQERDRLRREGRRGLDVKGKGIAWE